MNCNQFREQIPELLADRLPAEDRAQLIQHLDACSVCRSERAELSAVWKGLESMPDAEPGRDMSSRFRESLAAWQDGFREGRANHEGESRVTPIAPPRRWWQAAAAVLLLAAGAAGGRLLPALDRPQHSEIAALRGQVENLRQMVALSLLQEQSPGSRLRGVAYSYRLARPDRDVEQALLGTVRHDSNVNVRLAAVDALAVFSGDPEVRSGLAEALPPEDSPLVQIALIDLLAQANVRESAPQLRHLAEDANANDVVRKRAQSALERWGGMQ